jgi:UDP-GlcNAc:undecaprenyl-phosphate GlcNAc-1-phosphate transferase
MFRRFMGSRQMTDLGQEAQENWTHALRRMFRADQRHFHHRLIAIGFSHRNAVLMLYAIALSLSYFALLSVLAEYRNAGIILLTVVLAAAIGIGKLDYRDVNILRAGTLLRWYDNFAFDRRFFLGFIDLFLITSAYVVAFILKFYDGRLPAELEAWYLNSFPMVLIVQFLCFYLFGLYRGVWRAIGVGDLFKIVLAVGMGVIVSYSLVEIRNPPVGTISFFAIDLLVLGILAGAIRCAHRVLDYSHQRGIGHGGIALIYGAGRGGQLVLRELMQNTMFGLRPIGFIDDDPKLRNRSVSGVSVLGTNQDVPGILDNHLVTSVLISSKTIEGDRLREVIQACKERGVTILQAEFRFRPLDTDGEPLTEQTVLAGPPKEEHSLSM